MSVKDILQTRVDILQGQIDRAIESGDTHNIVGFPMDEQIKLWKKEIKKAKRQMRDA